MIKLEHIVKNFSTPKGELHAVNDVSLHIERGEIFGIIGFSGAGKSTLVRCINLLEKPNSGKVFVDGKELTALSEKEVRQARKKISMIFQHFNLMKTRNVIDNVTFPLYGSNLTKEQKKAKARKLLSLVGIAEKENAYPSELSGGQKQRVAIARALATDPNVLLCDEATSALDPQTTHSILQLLKDLNKKLSLTIVVITHEMAVVKEICSQIAVMENGHVVESGDVFNVFTNPQKEITRDFIRSTSNLRKIEQLIAEGSPVTNLKNGEVILRLSYLEKNVSEPLISTATQKFNISMNIVFADIEIIQDAPIGGTVIIVDGDSKNIDDAISWLREKNVGVEVIKDARISN